MDHSSSKLTRSREPWPTIVDVEDTIVDALERHYSGASVLLRHDRSSEINVAFKDGRRADIEITWHEALIERKETAS